MPVTHFSPDSVTADLRAALQVLQAELELPTEYPAEALRLAEHAATRAIATADIDDATEIELVTIDPEGSLDLDQAFHLATRADGGYTVHYAIADVSWLVDPGSALDTEVHQRAVTIYGPGHRFPLHPAVISEGVASLLPGQTRRSYLWRIELDAHGNVEDAIVRRALVRSRQRLTYEQVQADLDAGQASEMVALLPVIGNLRIDIERARGGVSLAVPDQQIVRTDRGHYELQFRGALPVEDHNAQLSLLTGIVAADMMWDARIGILRTLPPANGGAIARLRRIAKGLEIDWPADTSYGNLLATLDGAKPRHAAFLNQATSLFRGAGYITFDGDHPTPETAVHGALATRYAHVTAPMRRLIDRFGLEICLAISTGTDIPQWVRDELATLPESMAAGGRIASNYENGTINLIEALTLSDRIGQTLTGVIIDANGEKGRGEIIIADPAIKARIDGDVGLGDTVDVTVSDVDVAARTVRLALARVHEPEPTERVEYGYVRAAPNLKRFVWVGVLGGLFIGWILGLVISQDMPHRSQPIFFTALLTALITTTIMTSTGLWLEKRARVRAKK